ARRQRRQAQLPVPPQGSLRRDPGAGAKNSVHRPERRKPDHEVERRGDPRVLQVAHVRVRAGDRVEEDEGEREREDDEPAVAQEAQKLVAREQEPGHAAASCRESRSWVSCKNASSSPAPRISMSRASGYAASSARIAASESAQASTMRAPRCSARATPCRRSSESTGACGRVASIVLVATIALISVVGPSATTLPRAIRTARSAYASASSR